MQRELQFQLSQSSNFENNNIIKVGMDIGSNRARLQTMNQKDNIDKDAS